MAMGFGNHLGLADDKLQLLGMAGLLHDVGKMRIDPEILNKPGKLTAEEFELYVSYAGFEPLANFNESQSVQIVAGKALEPAQRAAWLSHIEKNREGIAYSSLYAELFAQSVDVLFGKLPPGDMLAYIDSLGDAEEAARADEAPLLEADDAAILEDNDLVGFDDRCDPLCHDDHRCICRHSGQRVTEPSIGGDIEG